MPSASFLNCHVSAVESGKKRQTIRKYRKKRPFRPGDTIYLFYALRTKYCRMLGRGDVRETCTIIIFDLGFILLSESVYSYTVFTRFDDLEKMANADGFNTWDDMRKFFRVKNQQPFVGQLIKW